MKVFILHEEDCDVEVFATPEDAINSYLRRDLDNGNISPEEAEKLQEVSAFNRFYRGCACVYCCDVQTGSNH